MCQLEVSLHSPVNTNLKESSDNMQLSSECSETLTRQVGC